MAPARVNKTQSHRGPGRGRTRANRRGGANGANGRTRSNDANGNGANGNGHRATAPGPLARDLVAQVAGAAALKSGTRNDGNGNGNGAVSKPQARRIAVKFGAAMLGAARIDTAKHSNDVVVIARALCEQLGIRGGERQDLLAAARLHDIGKVGVPSSILSKAGPLNETEWKRMRKHTEVGERILGSVPELVRIATMVRHSHERWDGAGYPDGLAGEQIPLGSRVIFCADAFHAIREDRPYRPGRSPAEALAEVSACAGTQFDPTVVSALEQVVRDLRIVPPPPTSPVRRSKRLMALLLMLVVGGGGTAVARTDLLGDPFQTQAGDAGSGFVRPVGCDGGACGSLLGLQLGEVFSGEDFREPASLNRLTFPGGALPPGSALPTSANAVNDGSTVTGADQQHPTTLVDETPAPSGAVQVQQDPGESQGQQADQGGGQTLQGSGDPAPPGSGGKGNGKGGNGHGHGWGGGHGGGKDHGEPGSGSGTGTGPGSHGSGSSGGHGAGGPGGPGKSGGSHGGSSGGSGGSGGSGSPGSGFGGPGGSGGHGGSGSGGSGSGSGSPGNSGSNPHGGAPGQAKKG